MRPSQAETAASAYDDAGQHETLDRMEGARNYNRWLLERARPFLGTRVLDVGAGLGTFTEMLAPDRELVVAVEPDEAFTKILERRFRAASNVVVFPGELERLSNQEPALSFDSAICFNVLEHIPDDAAALRTIGRVLRPDGHLNLLVPAHPRLYGSLDKMLHHERRYSRRALGRLLEHTGFTVRQLRYVNPVGALGWLVWSRLLRSDRIPATPLQTLDWMVPVLRPLDSLRLPFGLSLWVVAQR